MTYIILASPTARVTNLLVCTSHVLSKHSNGKRASLYSKFKIDYRLFVGMLLVDRLSFFLVSQKLS